MITRELPILFLYSTPDNSTFEKLEIIQQGKSGYSPSALMWDSVFNKSDTMSLQIDVSGDTPRIVDYLMDEKTRFIVRGDTFQICEITKREFDGKSVSIDGQGIENILSKVYTDEKTYLIKEKSTVGERMCQLINERNVNEWLVANPENNVIGEKVGLFTGNTGNVSKYLNELSKTYNVYKQFRFNGEKVIFEAKEIVPIDVIIPHRAYTISEGYGNAKKINFSQDKSKFYNICRVIGESGIQSIVDKSLLGQKYEISIKGKSKRGDLTIEEYKQLLNNEGETELAKRKKLEVVDVDISESLDLGMGWEVRISIPKIRIDRIMFCTQISESWENAYKRTHTLGFKPDAKDLQEILD